MPQAYQGASPNARLLAGDVQRGEQAKLRVGNALSLSVATHIGLLLFILFVLTLPAVTPTNSFTLPDVVWVAQEGPGGGGGGGGNERPEPPKPVELSGREKVPVPAPKPKMPIPAPVKELKPDPPMDVPVRQTTVQDLPGVIASVTAPTSSQGIGTGGGSGTGKGTGVGPGEGSGLGPGTGGGTGGGVFRPGNGVISPRLIQEVKPSYTADAMRAKIQGVVTLEAVVMPDGSIGNVQITRSLDPTFGLDQEAVKTVKKWRFAPGTRFGQAVAVLVEIEMTFTLR